MGRGKPTSPLPCLMRNRHPLTCATTPCASLRMAYLESLRWMHHCSPRLALQARAIRLFTHAAKVEDLPRPNRPGCGSIRDVIGRVLVMARPLDSSCSSSSRPSGCGRLTPLYAAWASYGRVSVNRHGDTS